MRTESTFCKRLKRFWLSSSVLNSLAPSYPFTFHFNFRFAYKQHLRKHSPALPFTCLPCLEKTKEGPKEIHRLQFKCMTVTPTYLVSKHPRVLQLQVNPAILAEWRSDRRYPWMEAQGLQSTVPRHWGCSELQTRTPERQSWTHSRTMGYIWVKEATSAQMLDEKGGKESQGVPKCCQWAEDDMSVTSGCVKGLSSINPESQTRSSYWQPQGFSSLHRHEAACHGTSTMANPAQAMGVNSWVCQWAHMWVGLGGARMLGWAKPHPFKSHFALGWNISGNSIQVPIHVVSTQVP